MYRCVVCGNESWWLENPKLDGCVGQFHKLPDNTFDGLSMLSDPYFYTKEVA